MSLLAATALLLASSVPPAAQAHTLIEGAKLAFASKTYADAGRLYVEAFEILEPTGLTKPRLLFNAGVSYERAGQCDRVAALFARFILLQPDAAQDNLLRERLRMARVCAPTIRLQTSPPGAAVAIDGKSVGSTPVSLRLKHGPHALTLRRDGHATRDIRLDIIPDRDARYTFALTRVATPPPPPIVQRARPLERMTAVLTTEPPAASRTAWAWGATGVGVAALIAGTATFAIAVDRANDANTLYRDRRTADGDALRSQADGLQPAYFTLFGVGAASLVTGGALLVWD